jgi:hypothetical protein
MSADRLLNPALHWCLQQHFGEVTIKNAGMPLRYDYIYDELKRRDRLIVVECGERYRVCCDRCGDKRQQLCISAGWYFHDAGRRRTWKHLIKCLNRDCYASREAREALHSRLSSESSSPFLLAPIRGPEKADLAESFSVPDQELPGEVFPLSSLKRAHRAVEYLESRNFDVDELCRLYDLGYCKQSRLGCARGRLIIPAYLDQRLVGWQARYIGELDWNQPSSPPKDFTCPGMKRGRVVYNLDRAQDYRTVVILKRPSDVWRLGPMAVAIWGSKLTIQQRRLLVRHCRHASVVMLLDHGSPARKSTRCPDWLLSRKLGLSNTFAGGFAVVSLPQELSPDSLTQDWLREYVQEHAAQQGVQVRWNRRRQVRKND